MVHIYCFSNKFNRQSLFRNFSLVKNVFTSIETVMEKNPCGVVYARLQIPFFSPHSRQCIDANTDTTNFAMTTIHHSSNTHATTPHNRRQTHQQRRHTTTTPPPATYHVPHATTWQTVLQRHIPTQLNTSLPRAKVQAHFVSSGTRSTQENLDSCFERASR